MANQYVILLSLCDLRLEPKRVVEKGVRRSPGVTNMGIYEPRHPMINRKQGLRVSPVTLWSIEH